MTCMLSKFWSFEQNEAALFHVFAFKISQEILVMYFWLNVFPLHRVSFLYQ